jgi:hypothetical protein
LNTCAQQFCSQYLSGANAYNAMAGCISSACSGPC